MEIFVVIQNIQCCDDDEWRHWIQEEQVALHLSKKGAEQKIKVLLAERIKKIDTIKSLNSHIEESYWNKEKELLENNKVYLSEDANGKNQKRQDLYVIKKIIAEE